MLSFVSNWDFKIYFAHAMQWYSVLNSVKNIYRKIIFQMGYKHRKNIAYHEGPTLKTESYNRLWGQSTSATCGLHP